MNPFKVLNVKVTDSDKEIRKRYLTLIKKYNPEKYPDKFHDIKESFDLIKDKVSRYEQFLRLQYVAKEIDFNQLINSLSIELTADVPKLKDLMNIFEFIEQDEYKK